MNLRGWKTGLIGAAVAVTALTGVLRSRSSDAAKPGSVEYKVEARMLGRSVFESGWLIGLDTEPVQIRMTGDLLEIPRSGARVRAGEVIIRVDDTQARERLEEVLYNTHDAEEIKDSCAADYDYTQCIETNRLALLKAQLDGARVREADARFGLKPEARRLLEIERELAGLDLEDAREEEARQTRLYEKGFISLTMLEPYQRKTQTVEATVKEVEAQIRLEEKGLPEEELLELNMQVERIQALLDRGEKAKERRLEYVQRSLAVAQARVEENLHDREQVDEDLAATEVRAPKNGVLSVRNHLALQVGLWTDYKPGDHVDKYDIVADVVNPGHVRVELMIHEADIDQVALGTKARIRLPAYPGRVFEGEVIELGGVGRDRADVAPRGFETGRAGVTMFNATVSLEGNGLEFRPGMSGLVELMVEPPELRLALPRAAVLREGGAFYVFRKEGRRLRKTEIRGRIFNEDYFVVEDGVGVGDVVAAAPPEGRV